VHTQRNQLKTRKMKSRQMWGWAAVTANYSVMYSHISAVLRAGCASGVVRALVVTVSVFVSLIGATTYAQVAVIDSRATSKTKLAAALQVIKDILAEDAKLARGFYIREPKFPSWKDQALYDCAGYMIARATAVREPYFEDATKTVVVVPVWAELLLAKAIQDGGLDVKADGSTPSMCAFEYERWSFERKKFEKIDGFRTRKHYDEFPMWGDNVVNSPINRWVAIDLDKRYVRFYARVSVAREQPYQLGPQFPKHYQAEHSLSLLRYYNQRKIDFLTSGKSDRDTRATGEALQKDLERMRLQLKNDGWAADRLSASLEALKNIEPFDEILLQAKF
jgi:hypothetical protein